MKKQFDNNNRIKKLKFNDDKEVDSTEKFNEIKLDNKKSCNKNKLKTKNNKLETQKEKENKVN